MVELLKVKIKNIDFGNKSMFFHVEVIEIVSQSGSERKIGDELSFHPKNYLLIYKNKLINIIKGKEILDINIEGHSVEINLDELNAKTLLI